LTEFKTFIYLIEVYLLHSQMGIVLGKVDVECAKYSVVKTLGEAVELRRYASCVAVETPCARMDGRDGAFSRLAQYIGVFGTPANQASQAIAMTAPVITNGSGSIAVAMTAPVLSSSNLMSFILPSSIRDVSEAPVPLHPQVSLRQIPERNIAYVLLDVFFLETILLLFSAN
jgi:hypothetical protein